MIKKIEIKNFQSHKTSVLEFDAGVNVIIGESDAGKSAIVKALNWCVNNRPGGDAFRSEWGGDTEVSIYVDNLIVTRLKKGMSINQYKVIHICNGKEQIYEGFGQSVPEEIQKIFNMPDLNFQYQIDSPFMLANTSGEVAKYFNKIANLEEIDKTLLGADREKRKHEKQINTFNYQISEYNERILKYKYLDKILIKYNGIEKLYIDYEKIENDLFALNKKIDDISGIEHVLNKFKNIDKVEIEIEQAQSFIDAIEKSDNTIEKLFKISSSIKKKKIKVKEFNLLLSGEKEVVLIEKLVKEVKDKINELHIISDLIYSIDILENEIKLFEKTYKQLETQFNELFPDVCPLCGSKIK